MPPVNEAWQLAEGVAIQLHTLDGLNWLYRGLVPGLAPVGKGQPADMECMGYDSRKSFCLVLILLHAELGECWCDA